MRGWLLGLWRRRAAVARPPAPRVPPAPQAPQPAGPVPPAPPTPDVPAAASTAEDPFAPFAARGARELVQSAGALRLDPFAVRALASELRAAEARTAALFGTAG